MDEISILYQQYCEQVRHHQDERRIIANTLIVVIAGLIALTAIDQKLDSHDFPVSIALIVVGLLGTSCMIKCHGLIRFYKNVAAEIAKRYTVINLKSVEEKVKTKEPVFWQKIDKMRLWHLWLTLFVVVTLGGVVMAFTLPAIT